MGEYTIQQLPCGGWSILVYVGSEHVTSVWTFKSKAEAEVWASRFLPIKH